MVRAGKDDNPVNVDEPSSRTRLDVFREPGDMTPTDCEIQQRVEVLRGIDDAPAAKNQLVGRTGVNGHQYALVIPQRAIAGNHRCAGERHRRVAAGCILVQCYAGSWPGRPQKMTGNQL